MGDLIAAKLHFELVLRVLNQFSEEGSRSNSWQIAISELRMRFAELHLLSGDLFEAKQYQEVAFSGFERLTAQDPTNLDWRFYEAVARYNLGRIYVLNEDSGRGLEQFRVALDVLRSLQISHKHLVGRSVLRAVEKAISAFDASERKL